MCREEEDFDPFLPHPPPPPPPHPLPHSRDKNGWQRYCLGASTQETQQQQPQQQQQQQANDPAMGITSTQSQQSDSVQQSGHDHQQLSQDQRMTEALDPSDGTSRAQDNTYLSASPASPWQDAMPSAQQSVLDQTGGAMLNSSTHQAPSADALPTTNEVIVAQASNSMSDPAAEAMYADPASHSDTDAQTSDSIHAEAGSGVQADTADVDADGMLADGTPDASESSGSASAEGHAPQMAVLASLDQVCMSCTAC